MNIQFFNGETTVKINKDKEQKYDIKSNTSEHNWRIEGDYKNRFMYSGYRRQSIGNTFVEQEHYENSLDSFVESPADSQVIQGYQFFKIFDEHQLEYILVVNGSSDDVYMVGKIAAFQIQNLLVAYKERFDKDNFIKNLLLDNLLLVDIYNRAKKLHIETDVRRVIIVIETAREKDTSTMEHIRSLLGMKSKDFVTAVDERNIIIVKELSANEGYPEMEKVANEIWKS